MKAYIKKLCRRIEGEKNIKILFAVENGSRAWRMESQDSDFDVRFVFVRPIEEYVQINKPGEVINVAFDDEGIKVPVQGSLIDFAGFDIFKFVKMLSSSNPTCIEWLVSDIVYHGTQNKVFKDFAINNFNRISLYHHYKSMCRNNYLKYLNSDDFVTYKRYLYALRGLVNAKWIVHKRTVPPIIFTDALKEMVGIIPNHILEKLNEIIMLKAKGKEKQVVQNIVKMDTYIEEFLKDDSEAPKEKNHGTLNDLNAELRKIVLKQK
ncbi:MAG: nucleotidyltransferase domain-containing protein [Nanoarchaeota archaeon]|nr:nucleotidyltransferase domain-containing protein [Nanoarchaeota archaeon]